MRRYLLLLLFIGLAWNQQIAKTNDGKAVVLYENGTWRYLEGSSSAEVKSVETKVFITKSGKKYHFDGCRWLKSKIPSTITDASSKGLTPCKVCSPPSLNNRIDSQIPTYKPRLNVADNRCQATTQKGTQCKRNSQSNSSYCWQHP